MLVAAGGVAGESSNWRKNDVFPLGPAGISDESDTYPRNRSKREKNVINECTYDHQKAQFGL